MPRLSTRVIEALAVLPMPEECHRFCWALYRETFLCDRDVAYFNAERMDRLKITNGPQVTADLVAMGVIGQAGMGWMFKDPAEKPYLPYKTTDPSKKHLSEELSPAFLAVKAIYPKRPGVSHSWHDAWRQWRSRLKEGDTEEAMLKGARGYAAYLAASVKRKPDAYDYVMAPGRFFGRDKHFEREWSAESSDNVTNTAQQWAAPQTDTSTPVFTEGIKKKV